MRDDTTPSTPRRGRPPGSTNTPKEKKPALTDTALRKGLTELYDGTSFILLPLGYLDTVDAVANNTDRCVDAWMAIASTSPAVRRTLERLVSTSTLGVIIAAHAPIIMAFTVEYRVKHAPTVIDEDPVATQPNVFPMYPGA